MALARTLRDDGSRCGAASVAALGCISQPMAQFSGPKCAINDSACQGWRVALNLLAKLTGWQMAGLFTLIGRVHWQGCLFVFGLHPCPMTREGILSCTHALAPPPRASAIQCSKRDWLGGVGLGWLCWLGWLGAGLIGCFGWVGWAWLAGFSWRFPGKAKAISRKTSRKGFDR